MIGPKPASSEKLRADGETRQVLAWNSRRDEYFVADLAAVAVQLESTPEAIRVAIEAGDAIKDCFVDWAAPSQAEAGNRQNHKL